jgi:hypothetical protein
VLLLCDLGAEAEGVSKAKEDTVAKGSIKDSKKRQSEERS